MAAAPLSRPSPEDRHELRALVARHGENELAGGRFVPLLPPLAELLGVPGLQRGSTVLFEDSRHPGRTALALALLAAATTDGMWCAVFGLPELGLAAASEIGVSFDRLVLVPESEGRDPMFLATLFEGCDIVCAALRRPLSGLDARRLVARVRERRGVLVLLRAPQRNAALRPFWPEGGDLSITVTGGTFVGMGKGEGRLSARRLEVTVRRRRGGAGRQGALWLPGVDGRIASGEVAPVAPEAGDGATAALA